MSFRQAFKLLFRRTCPVLLASTTMSVKPESEDKPTVNSKIQWVPPDVSKFTPEYMIKQSSVETVNSVTQALTIAYTAIQTTSNEYRESLSLLMSLIKDTLLYNVTDSHWDAIVAVRTEMEKKKEIVNHLVGYMEYVQKMGVAATEASYMAGMDSLSMTLCQRMDDALNNMTREVNHNMQLEKEYILLQEECVRKFGEEEASENADKDKVVNVEIDVED